MTEMNILDLFLKASLLVKLIMLILVCFSIASWAIIIQRTRILNSASREAEAFEDKFWSGIELSRLYQESQGRRDNLTGSEQIFYSGFKEFARLHRANSHAPEAIVEGASRAMRISMNRELETLETHIPFLGTVGSISPYIGLFGTVWGIMHAFIALGAVKQATLQMVAPGIAEALIATAIGLFAAIPAVMAYNRLNQRVNKLELNYDNFMEEFTAILHRQAFTSSESNKGEAMARARGRGRRELKSEINIVPLLDVLLVLLLIFMATAPIITQSVEVDLPDATESQAVKSNDEPPVIVEVSGVGQYSVKVGPETLSQLPPEQVIAEARRRLEANEKTVFLIGGAKEVPYDEIIKALNLLHSAGVKSVGLMTKPI